MTKKKDGKRRRKASKAQATVAPLGIKCRPGSGPHQQARRGYVKLLHGVGPTGLPRPNKNIRHKFVRPGKLATAIKEGQLGIFCVQVQWPGCVVPDPPGQADNIIHYDKEIFEQVDSGATSSVAVFGKPEGNEGSKRFLCFKASQRQREEVKTMWPDTRRLIPLAMKRKPDVLRGKQNGSRCAKYICFGHKKDPKGRKLQEYAFKPAPVGKRKKAGQEPNHASDSSINEHFKDVSGNLERISERFGKHLNESTAINKLREAVALPSFAKGSKATQFSAGLEYWSVAHTDNDYYHTTLSCLSEKEEDHEKVLYYFLFPVYGVAVPMRSGDILLFNQSELHCCSNPSTRGALIFSSYVSMKTCNTQVASSLK